MSFKTVNIKAKFFPYDIPQIEKKGAIGKGGFGTIVEIPKQIN